MVVAGKHLDSAVLGVGVAEYVEGTSAELRVLVAGVDKKLGWATVDTADDSGEYLNSGSAVESKSVANTDIGDIATEKVSVAVEAKASVDVAADLVEGVVADNSAQDTAADIDNLAVAEVAGSDTDSVGQADHSAVASVDNPPQPVGQNPRPLKAPDSRIPCLLTASFKLCEAD